MIIMMVPVRKVMCYAETPKSWDRRLTLKADDEATIRDALRIVDICLDQNVRFSHSLTSLMYPSAGSEASMSHFP